MVWLTAWLQRAWHSEIFHLFAYCGQSCILPFLAGLFCGIALGGLLYLHVMDFCSYFEEILKGVVHILDLFFCDFFLWSCTQFFCTLSSSKVGSFSLRISWPSFWSSSTTLEPSKQQVAEAISSWDGTPGGYGGATVARFLGLSGTKKSVRPFVAPRLIGQLTLDFLPWTMCDFKGKDGIRATRHTPTKASHMVRESLHCILSSIARVSWLSKN